MDQLDKTLIVARDIQYKLKDFNEWTKKFDVMIESINKKIDAFLEKQAA